MADDVLSKTELITSIRDSWNALMAYLRTLTDAQLTQRMDAVGWTVQDHVIHMATWEGDMCVLLAGRCRWEALDIEKALLASDDFDTINGIIQKRRQGMALADALKLLEDNHHRLMETLQSLSDEDLKRPYRAYQPDSTLEYPVFGWIKGCTYQHFAEHLAWIKALASGDQD